MKLFKLEIGNTVVYAAADSLEEMEERKAEVDHTFAFLPVHIEELTLEGFEINVKPLEEPEETPTTGKGRRKAAE